MQSNAAAIPGDINDDGAVDRRDILLLTEALKNPDRALSQNTDVDGSGQTTAADLITLVDLMNGVSDGGRIGPLDDADRGAPPPNAGALVELVPRVPGPYSLGQQVVVDIVLTTFNMNEPVFCRLIQLAFEQTTSGIYLPPTMDFFSPCSDDSHCCWDNPPSCQVGPSYIEFQNMDSHPATVWGCGSPFGGCMIALPPGVPTNVGTVVATIASTGILDVANRQEPHPDLGARLDFGFGNAPEDPITLWRFFTGELVGGSLEMTCSNCDQGAQPQEGVDIPLVTDLLGHLWQWDGVLGRFADPGETINLTLDQPTYLLTHGWDGNLVDGAMSSVACAIREANPSANLLAWDWADAANPNNISDFPSSVTNTILSLLVNLDWGVLMGELILLDAYRSGLRATTQGQILGAALAQYESLGSELHLIGKSHGGGVLGKAAQIL